MSSLSTNLSHLPYLEFVLGEGNFLLPQAKVREVSLLPELVKHPGLPDAVCGFFPGKGGLIPVLDAAVILEIESHPVTSETSLVFLKTDNPSESSRLISDFCLLVDRICGFRDSKDARVDSAPAELCFRGICPEIWVVGDSTLPILNPSTLLEPLQIQMLAEWTALAEKQNADWTGESLPHAE